MRTERDLARWLITQYDALGGHAQRIETSTAAGVPDIEAYLFERAIWWELKVGLRALSEDQIDWLARRLDAGGACGVLRLYRGDVVEVVCYVDRRRHSGALTLERLAAFHR